MADTILPFGNTKGDKEIKERTTFVDKTGSFAGLVLQMIIEKLSAWNLFICLFIIFLRGGRRV